MTEAISGLIVRMGLDPHYVMFEMDEWEISKYYEMMQQMDRDRLSEERLWTYLQVLPHVGKKLGDVWGYHVEGLFKTDREAAEYQATINDEAVNKRVYQCTGPYGNYLRAGDVKFADLDGDKKISEGSGTLDDHGDKIIIGNTRPRYNYSFRLGFNWVGLDVSAFFQGVGHRDWYPVAGQASYDFWGPYAFPPTSFIHTEFYENVWTETNRNAYFPRARGYNAYANGSLGTTNDRYLQNLAYLRF